MTDLEPIASKTLNHSVAKAFTVLEQFSLDKDEWGVREMAKHLQAHESTTYRLMATLGSLGVLRKDPQTDKYSLGLKLFELGYRVSIQEAFISHTHPVLRTVAEEITETVHLGILRNQQVFMVDKVESPKGLKLNSTIGSCSPLYCTSLGKILLAHWTHDQLHEYFMSNNFSSFTAFTLTQPKALERELDNIRKCGYAIDRQEFELGLTCVAVPVFNQRHQVVAALSAAGPEIRFREDAVDDYVSILSRGASSIQQKIGNFHP